MLRIPFDWLEFALEWFESILNGSNLDSKALNPFQMVRICIRMPNPFRMVRNWIRKLRIPFESFEFEVECFESLLNG